MKNIFNNQYIGWILFIMLIAGYSAYWVDNNRDFNEVIFDENNKVRDIDYIAKEYHKLFKDTDWENMPAFESLDNNDPNTFKSLYTNNNDIFLVNMHRNYQDNTIVLGQGIIKKVNDSNSIEDMISNIKPGFEILEKAYPKDRELLDEIYTEIPMYFTKYTNQENYQEKKYKETYYSVLEKNSMEFHQIYIYIINNEYVIAIDKIINREV